MRGLMKSFGALEEDLSLVESGQVHERVPRDLQPVMSHRQIAFHRMLLDQSNNHIRLTETSLEMFYLRVETLLRSENYFQMFVLKIVIDYYKKY